MSAQPELVIESSPRLALGRALKDAWAYRGTTLAFTERNVRIKYKQTIFGVLWVVLQPLAFMGVFTVALGRLADVPSGGVETGFGGPAGAGDGRRGHGLQRRQGAGAGGQHDPGFHAADGPDPENHYDRNPGAYGGSASDDGI